MVSQSRIGQHSTHN